MTAALPSMEAWQDEWTEPGAEGGMSATVLGSWSEWRASVQPPCNLPATSFEPPLNLLSTLLLSTLLLSTLLLSSNSTLLLSTLLLSNTFKHLQPLQSLNFFPFNFLPSIFPLIFSLLIFSLLFFSNSIFSLSNFSLSIFFTFNCFTFNFVPFISPFKIFFPSKFFPLTFFPSLDFFPLTCFSLTCCSFSLFSFNLFFQQFVSLQLCSLQLVLSNVFSFFFVFVSFFRVFFVFFFFVFFVFFFVFFFFSCFFFVFCYSFFHFCLNHLKKCFKKTLFKPFFFISSISSFSNNFSHFSHFFHFFHCFHFFHFFHFSFFLFGWEERGPVCRSHARSHFGSSMSLRATLKDVRLPWLSSLASQNGATGGMIGFSSVVMPLPLRRSCGDRNVGCSAGRQELRSVVYIALAPAVSRVAPAPPLSMRCASASRERVILVSVAHREGVLLLRFKAADHFAGRPEASSHRCDGMPGRMLAPATTVFIMAPAMPAMTGVASPDHVVVHIAPPQLCLTPRMRCRIRRRGRLHAVVG